MAEPIEVHEHGKNGSQVVVLHGGPGAQGSVTSLAGTLAPEYRVLEPMQRRSGGVSLTVLRHVEDLAEVAPENAVYVGWSWGAMLGLSFAALHPDRVRSLVLVGCGAYDEVSREAFRRGLGSKLGEQGRREIEELERRMERASDGDWRDSMAGRIGELCERAMAVDPIGSTVPDTHPDALGHDETWADVLRLQHECVEPARFVGVQCPVLMLHGDEDPHPGWSTRDTLKQYIPHLAYIGIARCGHVPWLERHGRQPFLASLDEWIAET